MKQARATRVIGASTGAAVLIADQVCKLWALNALQVEGASQPLIGIFKTTLVFNRSNAFGLVPVAGELSRWGLVSFNAAAAAALALWLFRQPHRLSAALGVGLLIAGALGNALDRLRLGFVVDFLDASALQFHWVFNLADAAVDAGIGCLALSMVILPAIQERRAAATPV
ncbi:MAG: lipoprotein signal peptidase [Alphaproteobacteria bacterium]|nr:lipoprotein signal peptidase [Alphaproteobacteria bacterium]